MKRERDTQRARFWKAINALDPFATPLREMTDVRHYIGALRENAAILRLYPQAKWFVEVKDGRGISRDWITYPDANVVSFTRAGRHKVAVVRALAFIIAYRIDRKAAWHGWLYCSILMALVRSGIGKPAAEALKAAFDREGVKYSRPIKRTLTATQKAAAVEKGEKLATMMKDRRAREKFALEYPEAPIVSKDEFGGDWEDLYRLWRP